MEKQYIVLLEGKLDDCRVHIFDGSGGSEAGKYLPQKAPSTPDPPEYRIASATNSDDF